MVLLMSHPGYLAPGADPAARATADRDSSAEALPAVLVEEIRTGNNGRYSGARLSLVVGGADAWSRRRAPVGRPLSGKLSLTPFRGDINATGLAAPV
jgi:hypothetical protein